MTTDQSRHTREPIPTTGGGYIIHYPPPQYQGGKFMNMNEKIPGLEMTAEEFLTAYHTAPAEIQKEIRRLLGLSD